MCVESEEEHSEDEPLINEFQLEEEEEEEDEDEEYGDEREEEVGKEEEESEEADDMEQVEENWDSIAIPVLSQERDTSQIQSGIISTVDEDSLGYHGDHDFTTISSESVQEDIDKGKAVKHQISEFYFTCMKSYHLEEDKSQGGGEVGGWTFSTLIMI